ncbi:MAG: hypothetical protein ACLQPD_24110 [Desulfomonilaceae bacterium]
MTNRSEDLSKLLEDIQVKQKETRRLREEGAPLVGIIYVIDHKIVDPSSKEEKELFLSTTPVKEAPDYGKFKIHERMDHSNYWDEILQAVFRKTHPFYLKLDYDFFPRGRVVYDTESDLYHLYLDKCIRKDAQMVSEIIREMNLPLSELKIGGDIHYQCKACNKNYVV